MEPNLRERLRAGDADAFGVLFDEHSQAATAFTFRGTRTEWIFSRQTLQYLGSRDIDVAAGVTTADGAVVPRGFVNHVGQLPG